MLYWFYYFILFPQLCPSLQQHGTPDCIPRALAAAAAGRGPGVRQVRAGNPPADRAEHVTGGHQHV